jgi:hypothetical protein
MRSIGALAFGSAVITGAIFARSAQAQDALPSGPGRDDVVAHCTICHNSDRILTHRMSADQWSYTVNSMIGLGAVVPDSDKIVSYLTANFGLPPSPAAPPAPAQVAVPVTASADPATADAPATTVDAPAQ